MVSWNNAPEWADRHGVVGTNRDPIWFNDTKYAYCETPDRTMQLNTTGVTPPYNWKPSDIQNVTERPATGHRPEPVNWDDAPTWANCNYAGFWLLRDSDSGKFYSYTNCVAVEFDISVNSPVEFRPTPPKVISLVSDDQARKIYYIAGPNFNRDAFNAAATKLTAAGHTALNPATLPDGLSQAQYMDICLAMLRCATHVQMLRGWDDSRGAFAERALALKLGLTVEYV